MRKCTSCGHLYKKPVDTFGWVKCPKCGSVWWRAIKDVPVTVGGEMRKKRYIVLPGFIKSKTDNELHYITAKQLIRLYGVSFAECHIVIKSEDLHGLRGPYIYLVPRYDGNYSLDELLEEELLEWPCQNLRGGTGGAIYSSVDGMCTHKECHPKNNQEEE